MQVVLSVKLFNSGLVNPNLIKTNNFYAALDIKKNWYFWILSISRMPDDVLYEIFIFKKHISNLYPKYLFIDF